MPPFTEPIEQLYRELTPDALAAFANAQGFTLEAVYPKSTTLETLHGEGFQVDIPNRVTFADYPRRVAEILDTLSAATLIPIPGLLHKISPDAFPVARVHKLLGLP